MAQTQYQRDVGTVQRALGEDAKPVHAVAPGDGHVRQNRLWVDMISGDVRYWPDGGLYAERHDVGVDFDLRDGWV